MPIPQMPGLNSLDDVINYVIRLERELRFLMEGGLDSTNAFEFGGWRVNPNRFSSLSGNVGMDSSGTAPTSIRFWAGGTDPTAAPFRVQDNGIMTAIGGLFQSAAGYPRVEINSANNLIAAYADPDTYISFLPSFNSVPTLVLVDVGTTKAFLNRGSAAAGTSLGTFDAEPLNLQASGPLNLQPTGNLQINGTNGFTGSYQVVTSVTFGPTGGGSYTSKTVTVSKGIITSVI